jgi:hypothetical protein
MLRCGGPLRAAVVAVQRRAYSSGGDSGRSSDHRVLNLATCAVAASAVIQVEETCYARSDAYETEPPKRVVELFVQSRKMYKVNNMKAALKYSTAALQELDRFLTLAELPTGQIPFNIDNLCYQIAWECGRLQLGLQPGIPSLRKAESFFERALKAMQSQRKNTTKTDAEKNLVRIFFCISLVISVLQRRSSYKWYLL